MQIRTATLEDAAAVAACEERAFASSLPNASKNKPSSPDNLSLEISEGGVHVICEKADILGYIAVWPTSDHLFVDTVAVLPGYRGRGLGSQLLGFAEQQASRLGLASVRLFTVEGSGDGLSFYHGCGYLETDRCADDGISRVFLSKSVAPRKSQAIAVPATTSVMEQIKARRQPNLQILEASNRQPVAADFIPLSQRRTIITVESMSCRWPIGDPLQDDFYLCGAKTGSDHSYCDRHMALAYVPASKSRRAA